MSPLLGIVDSARRATNAGFDSIATANLNGQSTYTFSSIPQTYKHLQLSYLMYGPIADMWLTVTFNGNNGSVYTTGRTSGNPYQGVRGLLHYTQDMNNNTKPAFGVLDIYDYTSSNFKGSKSQIGQLYGGSFTFGGSAVYFQSASPITSLTVEARYGGNAEGGTSTFNNNTVFALYGIKG